MKFIGSLVVFLVLQTLSGVVLAQECVVTFSSTVDATMYGLPICSGANFTSTSIPSFDTVVYEDMHLDIAPFTPCEPVLESSPCSHFNTSVVVSQKTEELIIRYTEWGTSTYCENTFNASTALLRKGSIKSEESASQECSFTRLGVTQRLTSYLCSLKC